MVRNASDSRHSLNFAAAFSKYPANSRQGLFTRRNTSLRVIGLQLFIVGRGELWPLAPGSVLDTGRAAHFPAC